MEREEALEIVKAHLTEHRYTHTVGVMETAILLAKKYGQNKEKAELAAIFHDYAKFRPKDEMKAILLQQQIAVDMLDYGDELLHAPCGAYLVKQEVGIDDEEVLQAIESHTTGRPNMTMLEKIIFISDYIEPNRIFPGVEEVRQVTFQDIDEGILMSIKNTVTFLMKKNQLVYPGTLATYNEMVQSRQNKRRV
ncbi:bis(5'-nucleosyl)-tetraphosphatase (symmetrical) YqeK [Alkalihalobacterium bogoriense]|uniref:bis(5'-nucleosyl)-tetraphosphatase (symmetrical) YqeK n=1 Tax=Alkalihalobacterium bogoriense TaxID=246272 RepID=UPI000479B189|nr:bis(5'-nucleosyl)-tetraphosphatase (symmetrical) YqeK [Alkalihalobacterium bogoriense]